MKSKRNNQDKNKQRIGKKLITSDNLETAKSSVKMEKSIETVVNDKNAESLSFEDELKKTPLLSNIRFEKLPIILKDAVESFDTRERDIILLSSIAILSGTLPNVYGIYAHNKVHPNLNVFIVAPPASGKSVMQFAKILGTTIHTTRREKSVDREYTNENDFDTDEENVKAKKNNRNGVKQELLFVPANSSSASLISVLNQNQDGCILCETEADTLSNALKQDWGGFSDIIRKAFHHETISYSRKLNNELIEIDKPKLSILLTSTPRQVEDLIKDAENGLFSRFVFYCFQPNLIWKDVFANKEKDVEGVFKRLSKKVLEDSKELNRHPIEFSFTIKQRKIFNRNFSKILNQYSKLTEGDSPSFVFRFGLIFFRIAMILSCYRNFEKGEINQGHTIVCHEDDFNTAGAIISSCLKHNLLIYEYLSSKVTKIKENNNESSIGIHRFLDKIQIEKTYKRNELIAIGKTMNLGERTIGNYLKRLLKLNLLVSKTYGFYEKITQ